jgi:hypothetical protein
MESEVDHLFASMEYAFKRYIRRQGDRLDPSGIYCKRHAIQLKLSLEKRASGIVYAFGKVGKADVNGPHLQHVTGAQYNFHYLVNAELHSGNYSLDPFFGIIVPKDEYIKAAYENPEDIVWGKPLLSSLKDKK